MPKQITWRDSPVIQLNKKQSWNASTKSTKNADFWKLPPLWWLCWKGVALLRIRPMSWMRIIPCPRETTPTSENHHGRPDYCRDIIDHCVEFVERASPCSEWFTSYVLDAYNTISKRTLTYENYPGHPDYCRDIDHCDDFVERASPCSEFKNPQNVCRWQTQYTLLR